MSTSRLQLSECCIGTILDSRSSILKCYTTVGPLLWNQLFALEAYLIRFEMDEEKLDEYAQLAHTLVDAAIDKALSVLQAKCSETDLATYRNENVRQRTKKIEPDQSEFPSEVPNIQWLTIEEFSSEKGEEKINEFIKTWFYEDSWLYCIDLIGTDELEFDTRYRYRVRWSIPTRRHPIPRATASVYFTIETSKITPKNFPINVYYVIEGNRLVHRPGQIRFEEKWLKDVIESKILLLKAIDF